MPTTDQLDARLKVLEKIAGVNQPTPTIAPPPVLPTETFTKAGKYYQFTAPVFKHKGVTYAAEQVIDNQEENSQLLTDLVNNQTSEGVFYPGLLVELEAPVS